MPWKKCLRGDDTGARETPKPPPPTPPKDDTPKPKKKETGTSRPHTSFLPKPNPCKPQPATGIDPKKQPPPIFGMDRKYEKAKADNIAEWENSSRDKTSEAVLKRLAQVQQVKSEAGSGDERAITEVMPWTKYIRGDGNGAREPPKPPMPAPPTNGASKAEDRRHWNLRQV